MTDEERIIKIYCLGDELEEINKIVQDSSTREEIVSKLKEAANSGKIPNPNGARATD